MTTRSIKDILVSLANNNDFQMFCDMLSEQIKAEITNKILSGNTLETKDYERVKIYHNLKNMPQNILDKMKEEEQPTKREKRNTDPY